MGAAAETYSMLCKEGLNCKSPSFPFCQRLENPEEEGEEKLRIIGVEDIGRTWLTKPTKGLTETKEASIGIA